MEKVLGNEYVTFWWDARNNVVQSVWHTSTERLMEEEFKTQLRHEVAALKKYRPEGYVADTRDFRFTITPEFQGWINNNIFPEYLNAGLKRFAFVASTAFISQLSIEQAAAPIEEVHGIQQGFFDNREEALAWAKHKGARSPERS